MFNQLLNQFRHCCWCGAPSFWAHHLCTSCLKEVQNQVVLDQKSGELAKADWRGYPLISLGSYRHQTLAIWIKALKGGLAKQDYQLIAKWWLAIRQTSEGEPIIENVTIVPSPPRQEGARDHAYGLAEALQQKTGWSLENVLSFQHVGETPQKMRSGAERRQRHFDAAGWRPGKGSTVVFVDDVVTTGSTTEAAWEALGRPKSFEVWCVAVQPKLAAKRQI
jgi:predicted amidophosphoribosyltransferase